MAIERRRAPRARPPIGYTSIYAGRRLPGLDARPFGLEILADGRILVSSFADKGVILAFVNGAPTRLIGDLSDPANFGTDTRRRRLAIPLIESGRVEIWQLP